MAKNVPSKGTKIAKSVSFEGILLVFWFKTSKRARWAYDDG